MRIFKFGGASVKDAKGVQNVAKVLKKVGYTDTLVIVSAMGKTTNALEVIVDQYFNTPKELSNSIVKLEQFHSEIVTELMGVEAQPLKEKVSVLIQELKSFFEHNKATNYSFVYDQVVSFGELLSTTIINAYLNYININSEWLDARKCVKTDAYYRDANLDWDATQEAINDQVSKTKLVVSQGFIGSDENNFTTTLGREGSDYTAAIFAYALNAESVTIWKDVPGVLNGDPRVFENTVLLNQISYTEAIELAFYGASVIHPKTLQPLQRKEIPLYVRSFLNPEGAGTSVSKGKTLEPHVPCYILKPKQVLIRLSSLDFSFMVEDNISEVFALLYKSQMRVDMIQNSAISFSVCVNNKYNRLEELLQILRSKFKVTVYEDVDLYTVRHFDSKALKSIESRKDDILLEQRAQETIQYVVKN
ncbi:aspartate kinase [Flavobacteriaceae bacterium]|uniref:aspartate kinase n=1 Tax=Candidatus Arcticimaribacter forsetii TaxID=2820661 RepID=UPI0020774E31|nr:aspartate kinase [Candidatus Arcticimaribacter forsetii]MDB2325637.1 aspartate kinase [Flavobacteriaceae bacterium]MDB2329704.1 aspartate kinase [Flavobacteriaceae bacterium]MDB4675143.1 aspartate kinase [Flavobacteriaceae bacterium]MDB4738718.1 aspartate kinase [Flavobacteriaceae bacterium]MDB4751833.1 aspartate kinase [Flavobacteriaceae bacterium]